MAGWADLADAVRTEAVTTGKTLSHQGRLLLVWWLVLPASAIVIGLLSLPGHPATAIGLLALAVALLCRFTRPIASLLVGAGVELSAMLWPNAALSDLLWPALMVLAYAVGRNVAEARRAMVALAIAAVGQAVVGAVDQAGQGLRPAEAALVAALVVLQVVLPGAVGMRQGERARAMDILHERNALLERANLLGEAQARMQERARIAGEMHDLLGHRLSLIALYAGALEVRTRKAAPQVSEQADLLRTTSRKALDELRTVLGILRLDGSRPDGIESTVGTRDDVVNLVAESRHAGLPITLSWRGGDLVGIDVGIRRAVNRIVREALTNVHKHAPGAPTHLTVTVDSEKLRINVRNAARPPAVPPPSSGLGLAGLGERARLAGGEFTAGNDPITGGFAITAELPLRDGRPDQACPAVDQVPTAEPVPSHRAPREGQHRARPVL